MGIQSIRVASLTQGDHQSVKTAKSQGTRGREKVRESIKSRGKVGETYSTWKIVAADLQYLHQAYVLLVIVGT